MQAASATHLIRHEHSTIAAVLNATQTLVQAGPREDPSNFFDTVSAMLFYVDEFPERRHHPTESNLLFPMLLKVAPELNGVIRKLEIDHVAGEGRVRELQHLLLAWRFLGDSRRAIFERALEEYVRFYLKHMRMEETELLPLVTSRLSPAQAAELDVAFQSAMDPLVGGASEAAYARLLEMITRTARNPVGLGASA